MLSTKCYKRTQGRYRGDDAERGSAAAGRRETKHKNKSQFKSKGPSQKKEQTNNNFGANSEDTAAGASEKNKSNTSEEPLKNVHTLNGTLPTSLSFVDETSPSNAFIPYTSPVSEAANSVTPDNETPASTPRNNISDISLLSESNGSLKCFQDEHYCKSTSQSTTSPHKSADNEITVDETPSLRQSSIPKAPVANTSKTEAPLTTTTGSSALLKNSGHSVASANGANISNSSTESCKTPVAPLNEVVITIEDDEETKLVMVPSSECSSSELLSSNGSDSASKMALKTGGNNLELDKGDVSLLGSENESSSGEIIYSNEPQSEEVETMTNVVDGAKSSMLSSPAAPPLPPPQPTPPAASTELKRGECALAYYYYYYYLYYIIFSLIRGCRIKEQWKIHRPRDVRARLKAKKMFKLDILASDCDDTSNTLPSSVEECTAISVQRKGFYFILFFANFIYQGRLSAGREPRKPALPSGVLLQEIIPGDFSVIW